MAITAHAYLNGVENLNNATINWSDNSTTTIKVALCTSTYTPNQDTHTFFSDITNEVSGTGYTAGGTAVVTRAISLDTGNNYIQLTGASVSWGSSASFTARYAIVYKSTGTASTSPLVGYVDFGVDTTVTNGTFTINWDATGIVRYTAS